MNSSGLCRSRCRRRLSLLIVATLNLSVSAGFSLPASPPVRTLSTSLRAQDKSGEEQSDTDELLRSLGLSLGVEDTRQSSGSLDVEGVGAPLKNDEQQDDQDELLGYAIDSLLRGDYQGEFADDAPAPHPGLTPGNAVESALRSLRRLDEPEVSHGAAVFSKFCMPLTRGERWGGDATTSIGRDPWKEEILRGALTPGLLAERIRASPEFGGLLDWTHMDVTEGAYGQERDLVGIPSMAYVNVALYFGNKIKPQLVQFTLRRGIGGVWLIDTAQRIMQTKL